MRGYCILIFGSVVIGMFWMADQDLRQYEMERRINGSFLILRGLLNLESTSKTSLDELISDARSRGSRFNYDLKRANPLPSFLPDYQYSVFPNRRGQNGDVLIKAHIRYWLRGNKDVILYWNGKITGFDKIGQRVKE